ncbi:hypothetical protein [Bacillus sp. T33-2]|uniref:hypothetical protein n=1 Tax=Bacillus sp. T33-2 TaxID=2054168 RepID=UPI000C75CE2A|nr:hypothetical protein [Bacillus sp. T33-2]PLR98105.1 hypothetical protein CVD19_05750 [Bacillus sp. T33-2]
MSFFRSLAIRYQKLCETGENHRDPQLKTRYYKANFNQVFQTVEQLLKEQNGKITNVSKDHGEIAAETNSGFPAFIVATIITTKPFETAVDFNISTDRFSPAGIYPALKKEVLRLYGKLDKAHTFVGSGKNGNV